MKVGRTLTVVFAGMVSGVAAGEHFAFVGARASSMGGANAASVNDATAQWHNPAVLGFMHQSRADKLIAETNTVIELEEPVAETNAVPVAVTNTVEAANAETNAVVELEEPVAETNAVPVAEGATNVVDALSIETNAMPEVEAALPDSEAVMTDDAELSGNQVVPIPGPFGPMEPKSAAPDEEVFDLLDNNGLADKHFGWNLVDVSVGYTMTEDMGRYLDTLADIDFANIDDVSTPERVSDLVAMASALSGVSEPGNSFYVDANAGTSVRMGHFAVGLRLFGEAALRVDELDSNNLGLNAGDTNALNANIATAAGADGFSGGPSGNFSADQQTSLAAAGLSSDSINYLDYKLGQLLADGTLQQSDVDNTTDLLADVVSATGGSALSNNTTAVAGRGFALAEIPISYGRAVNDHFSWGVTAKAMYGRVLGTRIWVFDEDNLDEAVQSVSDTESDTLTFGLDLGALYRIKNFQFAAVAHNINRPTFDGYDDSLVVNGSNVTFNVPDVEIDPQVTLGAAFIPSKRFTLEVNYDLLETGTLLEGYDIQRLSVGGELDLWALALRVGAYNNLAESAQDWVATAGVGFNIFGLRTDIGGAYSLGENAEIDGTEVPAEARVFAGVGLDF